MANTNDENKKLLSYYSYFNTDPNEVRNLGRFGIVADRQNIQAQYNLAKEYQVSKNHQQPLKSFIQHNDNFADLTLSDPLKP